MRSIVPGAVVLAAAALLAVDPPAEAQTLRRRDLERLGVDVVDVQSGPRLRGAILDRDADGNVTMAVRRAWLKAEAPGYYRDVVAAADDEDPQVRLVRLRERLLAWLDELDKADADEWDGRERLVAFLRKELERVDKELADPVPGDDAVPDDAAPEQDAGPGADRPVADQPAAVDAPAPDRPAPEGGQPTESEFVRVAIRAERIRRAFQQPIERRRVAAVAWRERLDGVESRPVADLTRALAERGIDPAQETPDLSDRLPPAPETDRQWAARRALVEYEFGRRLEFQGTGEFVVRTPREGIPGNVPGLMLGLLREQLNRELGDLLNEPGLGLTPAKQPGWHETATQAAEQAGVPGVRVTRVSRDLRNGRASVESRFLARMPDGSWETVWLAREAADATAANKGLEARIRQDPQFQQIERLTGLLGGVAGEDEVRKAIRFGAATMEAQQAVEGRWWEFREKVTKRLDRAWVGGHTGGP